MASAPQLEIKVLYSASQKGKRRAGSGGRPRVATIPRASGRRAWAALGLLNLLAAGALCYAIWWKVDPFLYVTMVMRTPVGDVDLDLVAAQVFGIPQAPAGPGPAEGEQGKGGGGADPAQSSPQEGRALNRSQTAQAVIVGSAYCWLALAAASCCALAFSAGGALGRLAGAVLRLFGIFATLFGLIALAYVCYRVWIQYGTKYRPTDLRIAMSLFTLLAAFAGLAASRLARRVVRLAAVLLIISAAGSVVGLYLGSSYGAISASHATPLFLVAVFLVHSFYGWILLPVSYRIGR